MDERGFLRVTGRLKDMILRGGENIYPAEIEARLMEHPAVVQAAVFGMPDSKWGEIAAGVIVPRADGEPLSVATLVEYCRRELAPHKTPVAWFISQALPLTSSGKVQKFRLRELARDGALLPLQ